MTRIELMSQGVDVPPLRHDTLTRWVTLVARGHGRETGRVTYVFCDDDYILDTNRRYLGHDYYTDIITFDYSTRHRIAGDLVISLDTVASNARQLGVPVERELHRVMIHGVLHLCGIDDKGPGQRAVMEAHEDAALELLDTLDTPLTPQP